MWNGNGKSWIPDDLTGIAVDILTAAHENSNIALILKIKWLHLCPSCNFHKNKRNLYC